MKWIKNVFSIFVVSLLTIFTIDLVSYQFKDHLNKYLPKYGSASTLNHKGYPRYHFSKDSSLGFDISKNYKTSTSIKPYEYKSYDVWGNSQKCFDDEWVIENYKTGVYLAGDSLTWGYASYDKKFGTLLENKLQRNVFACGVSHTGQRHQYLKFKRLFDNGIKPEIVIINMSSNDLDNDFFFPHSTVIEGYLVENIESCGNILDTSFSYRRLTKSELKNSIGLENKNITFKSFLKEYSFTANIIAEITRGMRNKFRNNYLCRRSVYVGIHLDHLNYEKSRFTEPNRNAIVDWIIHSRTNGYKLIFSFIPSQDLYGTRWYVPLKKILNKESIPFIDFMEYLNRKDIPLDSIFYKYDGHLNEYGNLVYAEFLYESISR